MKTPREVLLRHLQDTGARLDDIRKRVIAEELVDRVTAGAADGRKISSGFAQLALRIWNELFWSCRRAWLVLATAWVVIIAVNSTGSDEPSARWASHNGASGDIWALLVERQRLSAELMDSTPQRPVAPPRPRSEYRVPSHFPIQTLFNERA
jgi:hypothetical protein